MRIVFLSKYPPLFGGIADDTKDLVDALRKNNDVYVISFKGAKGKNVYPLIDSSKKGYTAVLKKIESLDPDIIHIQHEWGSFGLSDNNRSLVKFIDQLKGKSGRVVITFHNSLQIFFDFGKLFGKKRDKKKFRESYRLLCEKCTVIVPNTQQVGEVEKNGGAANYIPLPLPNIRHEPSRKMRKMVLIQGSIHQGKGINRILAAWKRIRRKYQDVRLNIVGGIPKSTNTNDRLRYVNKLVDNIAKRQNQNIHLDFGIVSARKYHQNICSAYFSILPYAAVSQSGVLLDNYAHGTPVITSKLPFFVGEVAKYATGITCRTTNEYENAFNRLFSNNAFYQKLRKNIYQRKHFFDIQAIVDQHTTVYQKVMMEDTMEFRKNVSAIVMWKGKVLITKKPNRDSWQFPQGGIENGETPREAILRELHEELNVTKSAVIGESKFVHQYDWPLEKQKQSGLQGIRQGIYYIQLQEDPKNLKVDSRELEKFDWIEPEKVRPFFQFQNLLDLLDNIQGEMNEMVRRNK